MDKKQKARYLTITALALPHSCDPAPSLRIGGRWLERAGFVIGKRVRIDVQEGFLVISVVGKTWW